MSGNIYFRCNPLNLTSPFEKFFFRQRPFYNKHRLFVQVKKRFFFLVLDMQHDSGALRKSRGNRFPTECCCIFFQQLCVERHLGVTIFKKGQNSIRLGDKSILHASWAGAGYKFTRSRKCNKARFSFFSLDLHINVYTVVVVVYDSHLLSPHHQRK